MKSKCYSLAKKGQLQMLGLSDVIAYVWMIFDVKEGIIQIGEDSLYTKLPKQKHMGPLLIDKILAFWSSWCLLANLHLILFCARKGKSKSYNQIQVFSCEILTSWSQNESPSWLKNYALFHLFVIVGCERIWTHSCMHFHLNSRSFVKRRGVSTWYIIDEEKLCTFELCIY